VAAKVQKQYITMLESGTRKNLSLPVLKRWPHDPAVAAPPRRPSNRVTNRVSEARRHATRRNKARSVPANYAVLKWWRVRDSRSCPSDFVGICTAFALKMYQI